MLTLQRSNSLLDKSITAGGESRMRKCAIPLSHSGWKQAGTTTTGLAEVGFLTQTGEKWVG